MAEAVFRGFVLHTQSLTASRLVVTVFTKGGGKRKGVLRLNKKTGAAYLAPLTCIDFHLRGKEHQELQSMGQLNLVAHPYDIGNDYLGLTLLHHWSFLIEQSQPSDEPDDRVYRLVEHGLASLAGDRQASLPVAANLYLEAWLLHFCGVLPRKWAMGAEPSPTRQRPAQSLDDWIDCLPADLLNSLFQQKIEDFGAFALQWGSLAPTSRVLGNMWRLFLAKEIKTRTQLVAQFNERGLL